MNFLFKLNIQNKLNFLETMYTGGFVFVERVYYDLLFNGYGAYFWGDNNY